MSRSRPVAAFLVAALAIALGACRSTPKQDPILALSADEALVAGKKFFEQKKYARARPYLSHAYEVEPNSASGREALLLVADALFLEGGSTNWIQAEAKYRDYQNRFPTSERAAYVQFQIGRALSVRMERPDRDPKSTEKAKAAFEDLMRLYPTSEYAPRAEEELRKVRNNLAEHELLVAVFYYRYKLPSAAATRIEGLLKLYPEYAKRDRALLTLGLAYRALGRADDAAATFSRLRNEFPKSRYIASIPKANPLAPARAAAAASP